MTIEQIKENVFPEDKMMVAVSEEVTEDYVNKVLRGARDVESDAAKSIIKKLRRLAKINMGMQERKLQVVTR